MKKWAYILIVILVLSFTTNYYYSKFSMGTTTKLSREMISIDENYYLGYGLNWRGLLSPELVDISLRNLDGSLIDQNYDKVELVSFIDLEKHTGSSDESGFKENTSKGLVDYVPISHADINEHNLLVLRINVKDEGYINTVDTIILSYKILGIPKQQVIKFDGFLY